jgi:predicted MFS family arabinose efflux permease
VEAHPPSSATSVAGDTTAHGPGPVGGGLSGRLVALIAVATGAVVANLYYAQPLLHDVARTFGVGSAGAASVVTVTQVGYAAGLLVVVPLGDLHPRRHLVVTLFLAAAASLVLCATAPSLWLFEMGAAAAGCTSVAGQVMIPFAADLAPEARRGRVVARIMTGLLLGILLARTASGLVAQAAGWRAIYWASAALMLVFAAVMGRALPGEADRPHVPYRRLVGSSLRLLVDEPVVRRRAVLGACTFAAFSVLWTSLAFLLSAPPYRYGNAVIGLFGLAGVAGVLAANLAGRMADAQRATVVTTTAAVLLVAAYGLLALGRTSILALLAGIVVLDLGTQGMQITNQAVIYAVRPDARSRVNSAYMVCYFVGGAAGSVTAGAVFGAARWDGVCVLGAGFGALALLASAWDAGRGRATRWRSPPAGRAAPPVGPATSPPPARAEPK